jgi:hypothetical protein
MGARDNQNSANGGSCYCKNPAVHGGSIKATEKAREGQRMDEPGDEAHFLIGPDGLVWHSSWSPRPELEKKREAYTRAYELGRAGVLEENVALGKRF